MGKLLGRAIGRGILPEREIPCLQAASRHYQEAARRLKASEAETVGSRRLIQGGRSEIDCDFPISRSDVASRECARGGKSSRTGQRSS